MVAKRKCYLSTSNDSVSNIVRSILRPLGMATVEGRISSDIYHHDSVANLSDVSDIAIFVVSDCSEMVLYEIGICIGRRIPTLVLVDDHLVDRFIGPNRTFVDMNDHDTIVRHVQHFVDQFYIEVLTDRPEFRVERNDTYSSDIKHSLLHLKKQANTIRNSGNGYDLVELLNQVFKCIGLLYEYNPKKSKGVDFALWSSKLDRIIEHPIVVEVKYGLLSESLLESELSKLSTTIEIAHISMAIFLYMDMRNRRFHTSGKLRRTVLLFDVEDFISDLEKGTFESILLSHTHITQVVH